MPNYANQYNSSLTSGYTVGDTVLNVGSLPNDFPTVLVAARGTTNETVFQITNGSSGQLTGVSRLRGANVNLPQGTAIEGITVPELWNQYATAIFEQAGLKNLLYGVDGGSTDDYEITLATTPSSYTAITGVPIVFMANTINTGASTLNINSLGVKDIKKQGSGTLVDLDDGDIQPNQLNIVIYDGTQFQLVSSVVNQSVKNYVDSSIIEATDGATVTFDLGNGANRKHKVTITDDRTFALSNVKVGQVFIIDVIQGTGGSHSPTWFSTIKWAGGSAPDLSTDEGTIDTFGFICTSTGNYQGYVVGQGVA